MQSANNPGKLVLPFAATGSKRTIPATSQIGITAGAASLPDGFPPLTMIPETAGGVGPSGMDMNGILYELSAITRWANAGGGYPYDAAFASDSNVGGYPKGARVMRTDGQGYWLNTVDDNATDPESGGAGWVPDFSYGASAITMTSTNYTLSPLEYGKPIIVISGVLTANLNLVFPSIYGQWIVANSTTGNFTITAKTTGDPGVALAKGTMIVIGDGSAISAIDASGVVYTQGGVSSTSGTIAGKLSKESVTPFDFMTPAQKTDVYAGTRLIDVSDAFNKAGAASFSVKVPGYDYLIENPIDILDGQVWAFQGAVLHHTDDTKHIIRVNGRTGWAILGKVTLRGTLTMPATAAETGLYVTGGKRYRVEGVTARNFKGKGIWLDGANPSGLRGDRGQFTDCSTYECTVGRQIDAGAEYTTWSNFNASGCVTGEVQSGGNVITLGGTIVDNTVGVSLLAGSNHLHGMHVGVAINHNTTYNIQTTDVTNGHDFIGCHMYGNGAAAGALFFNNSKGIVVRGGHLDCWVYNYSGASSGYNYITDVYCPGSYGDIKRLDAAFLMPQELIVKRCDGLGAYDAGVTINDPGDTYVCARRLAGTTQAMSGPTVLKFPDVQQNGDRRRAYNPATGVFTVPANQAGQYRISGNLYFSGTGLSPTASYVEIAFTGVSEDPRLQTLSPYNTTILCCEIGFDVYLNADATVTITGTIGGTSPTFGGASWASTLSIQRIA